jgi:hypothetical protein
MQLYEFQGAAPATAIAAKLLDSNFRRLRPINNSGSARHYLLTESPDGWSMKIFPDWPNGGTHVLGFANGSMQWIPTTGCP